MQCYVYNDAHAVIYQIPQRVIEDQDECGKEVFVVDEFFAEVGMSA